jgi:hypothetical protein
VSDLDFATVTITPPPVSLDTAKLHLRLLATDTTHDADLTLKLQTASDYVLGYLKQHAYATWTEATLPARVQAAMLFYLELLFDHDHRTDQDRIVAEAMGRLLATMRDPAVV